MQSVRCWPWGWPWTNWIKRLPYTTPALFRPSTDFCPQCSVSSGILKKRRPMMQRSFWIAAMCHGLAKLYSVVSQIPVIINIDHHITNNRLWQHSAHRPGRLFHRGNRLPLDKSFKRSHKQSNCNVNIHRYLDRHRIVSVFKHQPGSLCHQPGDGSIRSQAL